MDNVFAFTFTYVSHDFFFFYRGKVLSIEYRCSLDSNWLFIKKGLTKSEFIDFEWSKKKRVRCEVRNVVGHIAYRHFVGVCLMVFAMAVMQKVL